jgi:arylsulfatase A-like enzyme
MDPHGPYFEHPYNGKGYHAPVDPSQAQFLSDAYDGEITYLDTHLGDVFAALKRLGLYDDALIVFTSDHGEEFYEHQGWSHGWTLYQEITHVPLIIKYPGNVRHSSKGEGVAGNVGAGTVDEGLARSLDIAPTVLDVAGIEPPAAMRGVSLRLPPDSPTRAQFSVAETSWTTQVMAVRTPRYKLIEVVDGPMRGRAPTQLYDLVADPGEQMNLAATRPDIVARLRAVMSRTLVLAERSAVGGQEGDFDPAFLERLGRLGY